MSIFVSIAAYEDWDVFNTVKSLRQATVDDLRIVVVMQTRQEPDFFKMMGKQDGTEWMVWPKGRAKGVGPPRHAALQLYQGEDWVLQIDSHHRFVRGWDKASVEMVRGLQREGHDKPILTSYLRTMGDNRTDRGGVIYFRFAPYQTTNRGQHKSRAFFNPRGGIVDLTRFRGLPTPACHASGHFWFAPGQWVEEVSIDPGYYFSGEEPSMAIRAFTHGYDMFHPCHTIGSHEYGDYNNRKRVWDGNPQHWWANNLNDESIKRLETLVGWRDGNLGKWGIGPHRSLADWQDYSGINYETLTTTGPDNRDWIERQFKDVERRCAVDMEALADDPEVAVFRTDEEARSWMKEQRRDGMPKAQLGDILADVPCRDCGKDQLTLA